jgi:hypothetical protein
MTLPRYALLIPFAALAACGGGTIRVADDDANGSGPVSLAPAPDSEPQPSVATAEVPPAEPAGDSTAASPPNARGYASYGGEGTANTLDIRRIGQWSRTGIGERRRLVIRDANTWADFWAELGTGERPDVDFTKAMVVAVAAGQRPSGGYEIAVNEVRQSDGELLVEVLETSPGPNCLTSSSPTQPADVVVVPIVAPRSWSFSERTETRSCR